VLAGVGIGVGVALRGSAAGSISLPGRLLGVPKYTGQGARRLDASIARQEVAVSKGQEVHVAGAFYGNPDPSASGPTFFVGGGGWCGTCRPSTTTQIMKAATGKGVADARSFPLGPGGGALVCYSAAVPGGTAIACTWADPRTGGDVVYHGGAASGLADAAAKTRRILAAIEH